MPALDYLQSTAVTTADISADANGLKSTAAVNLGRSGFPQNMYCTVVVSEASAADFTSGSTRRLRFRCEYTTDNGTTWHVAGMGDGKSSSAGVPLQLVTFPVGLTDIVPEQNAASDIDWRVTSDIQATLASADDFDFQGFLGYNAGQYAQVE